jgi:hypothetical protein
VENYIVPISSLMLCDFASGFSGENCSTFGFKKTRDGHILVNMAPRNTN